MPTTAPEPRRPGRPSGRHRIEMEMPLVLDLAAQGWGSKAIAAELNQRAGLPVVSYRTVLRRLHELQVGSRPTIGLMQELLAQVDQYLTGRITLEDMRGWVLSHLQSIIDSGEAQVIELADFVDAGSLELDEGVITLAEFREGLGALVTGVG